MQETNALPLHSCTDVWKVSDKIELNSPNDGMIEKIWNDSNVQPLRIIHNQYYYYSSVAKLLKSCRENDKNKKGSKF